MRLISVVLALLAVSCSPSGPRQVPPSQLTTAAEQIVQSQLDAYNDHDVDRFVATYDPAARIFNYPDQVQYEGAEDIKSAYAQFFAAAPDVHASVLQRIRQGDYVIDLEQITGVPGAGTFTGTAIYEVRNGKIQSVRIIR